MKALLHWLKVKPTHTSKPCWKDVLECAIDGGSAAEQSLERMLDHVGRTA